MRKSTVILLIACIILPCAAADWFYAMEKPKNDNELFRTYPLDEGIRKTSFERETIDPLLTVKQDTYGPGIGQDQYGRSTKTEVLDFPKNEPASTLDVKTNTFGPGIGHDQYGRPVRYKTW